MSPRNKTVRLDTNKWNVLNISDAALVKNFRENDSKGM